MRIVQIDPKKIPPAAMAEAVETLRAGKLVAFPTETVYGLGADALNAEAVTRIFQAKGRPATNPVIVHLSDPSELDRVAQDLPRCVAPLAKAFWPGPLTLVVPKNASLPDVVTAGGPTVAVRIPKHPVALALLHEAKIPIAAPSANRSTQLSPTRAEHVVRQLGDRVDLVLDGGPTSGGIESTVLDVTVSPPRLLRPGLVTCEQIEAIVGPIGFGEDLADTRQPARSPGQMDRHYAPRTPLIVCTQSRVKIDELTRAGLTVGWVTFETSPPQGVVLRTMPSDAEGYASRLYDVLHDLDQLHLDRIVVEAPPRDPRWLALHDRLKRASALPSST